MNEIVIKENVYKISSIKNIEFEFLLNNENNIHTSKDIFVRTRFIYLGLKDNLISNENNNNYALGNSFLSLEKETSIFKKVCLHCDINLYKSRVLTKNIYKYLEGNIQIQILNFTSPLIYFFVLIIVPILFLFGYLLQENSFIIYNEIFKFQFLNLILVYCALSLFSFLMFGFINYNIITIPIRKLEKVLSIKINNSNNKKLLLTFCMLYIILTLIFFIIYLF